MNIDKAKILLDKINVLMRSMAVAPDQIADIEQDLMKNYIRQLYESVLEESAPAPKPTPKPRPVKKEVVPPPTPEPIIEPEPIPESAPVKAAPVAPKPKPTPPPAPEPPVEMEVVAPPPPAPKPTPKPAPAPKPVVTSAAISADLEEVFTLPTATDLGEKLSQSPIKDLTKAFSINERMFTIKELFGDNNDLFNNTIKQLNGLKSFEEAKKLLATSVASEYGWSKKSKQKKAKEFVKLIKRRYN